VHRRDIDAKQQANSEHAFTADHPYFQGVAIHRSYQRDQASGGEVNVPNTIAPHAENIGEDQLDRLAVREQMLKILVRQGGEQTVPPDTAFRELHRNFPVVAGHPTGGTTRV